jgi:PAS domain S-box-containing protein
LSLRAERPGYRAFKDGRPLPVDMLPMQRACRGETVRGDVMDIVRADGSTVTVYCSSVPVLDENGRPRGAVGAFMDVTELKQAEAALRESEARLRMAKAAAGIGIHDYDVVTGTVQWDERVRELWGVGADVPITYEIFLSGLHPDDRERVDAAVQKAVDPAGDGRFFEIYRVKSRNNAIERWVEATGRTFFAQGRAVRLVGTVRDITADKRAEDALHASYAQIEAANKQLDAFAYSVSHDLRAPLRGMNGFASILREQHAAKLDDDALHCLDMITDNSARMGRLIDDLLAFCRLSQRPFEKERVAMDALVDSALKQLRSEQENRTVEITVAGLPDADADPRLLEQVWINLLSNALKFTRGRDPAVIRIGHEVRDGARVYFVRDNGTGFDMRYAHKLFGIFQRLHRDEDFEGTGVGLAISERIVTRHGGRIWAEAKKNEGATFYFTLSGAANA